MSKYLAGTNNCFGFANSCSYGEDYPMAKTQGRESNQSQKSGLNSDAPKKNLFNVLKSRGD